MSGTHKMLQISTKTTTRLLEYLLVHHCSPKTTAKAVQENTYTTAVAFITISVL